MDTIFALATARGRAGVAIVRISGPDAVRVTSLLCETVPENRGIRRLTDSDGDLIDVALVLQFASGQSFTGEQTVELHLHGSPAIVDAVTGVLADHARLAEAGEFTRRALENGCLDLAQVEGLADLIDAETEAQRKQAVRVFDGALGDLADAWRSKLVRSAALIEATIDFADEDVPEDVLPEVRNILTDVQASLQTQISGFHAAERVRDGFEVAIVGPPNAGKSTLLNRLAGRDAAITSEIAGTTRDVIEVRMDLSGIPVTFLDTAGLRDSEDTVEQLGVELAVRRAKAADLRIFLSADDLDSPIEKVKDDLSVAGKADLNPVDGFAISGVTGEGVQLLVDKVTQVLAQRAGQAGVALRDRHRAAMTVTSVSIETVFDLIDNEVGLDLVAQELRLAIGSVDMIVGRVDVEDLLDEIFSSFCIGK